MPDVFGCTVSRGDRAFESKVSVTDEGIEIRSPSGADNVDFSHVRDFRLINYHLFIETDSEKIELSRLGADTENFFEKLWLAYDKRSREALFLEGAPERESEGDYAYTEVEYSRVGKAKTALYKDSLCILPHNEGARRIPLCFSNEPQTEGYRLTVSLDTGEEYGISRLGHDTLPFFEKLCSFRKASVKSWTEAHKALETDIENRLGELKSRYDALCAVSGKTVCGLFSPDDESFWFAAVKNGRAAVELAIGEKAATYLYRFDLPEADFINTLRHAMEAVGKNREVIYLSEDELLQKPLCVMSVKRSRHVRFLRSFNAGRLIHTALWEKQLSEFFEA